MNEIHVNTGEIKRIAKGGNNIIANGIGSCIILTYYGTISQQIVMSHILLPGFDTNQEGSFKYAGNSINEAFRILEKSGENKNSISICMIGGANVLKRKNDTICDKNIFSVKSILQDMGLTIEKEDIGGELRRAVHFNVDNMEIKVSIGNKKLCSLLKY